MPWLGGSTGLSTLAALGPQSERKGLRKAQKRRSQVRLEEGWEGEGATTTHLQMQLKPSTLQTSMPFPLFSPSVNLSFNQFFPFILTTLPISTHHLLPHPGSFLSLLHVQGRVPPRPSPVLKQDWLKKGICKTSFTYVFRPFWPCFIPLKIPKWNH